MNQEGISNIMTQEPETGEPESSIIDTSLTDKAHKVQTDLQTCMNLVKQVKILYAVDEVTERLEDASYCFSLIEGVKCQL